MAAEEGQSPVTAAVHAIRDRQLTELPIPDDRSFLKKWRRELQDCLAQQNARIVSFLIADPSGALGDTEIHERAMELLARYAKALSRPTAPSLPPSAQSMDAATAAVEAEIGISPVAFRDVLRRVMRMYVNAATQLGATEARLEEKLKRLDTVLQRVNDQMFLESTPELELLAEPMRLYLESVLSKIDISADYTQLVEQYKQFALLRGLVSLQTTTASACTICMTRPVSMVLTSCGHTFCEECCKTQMTTCYICRTQIRDRIRIYFG